MIARVESLGAENLEAQEHYSRYKNSTFLCITMVPSVSKYLLNGIPSHVLTVIRMLTLFLAGISKNKHNYRLPRFCVFLYEV